MERIEHCPSLVQRFSLNPRPTFQKKTNSSHSHSLIHAPQLSFSSSSSSSPSINLSNHKTIMLKKLIPSCISTSTTNPETESQPQGLAFKRTSLYETHLGRIILSWSYATTGFSIYTEICFSNSNGDEEEEPETCSLEINPSLLGELSGTKNITTLKDRKTEPFCHLLLAWNVCNAQGATLPTSNYYFCIVSDEEMIILLGDMQEEAYKLTKARKGRDPIMISREDKVKMEGSVYYTKEIFGGVEKEISVNLSRAMEGAMSICMDGRKLVKMNNLLKMFRGSFKLDMPGGDLIHITWDLYKWLISCGNNNTYNSRNEVRKNGHIADNPSSVDEVEADGVFMFSFVEKGGNVGLSRSNESQENYVRLLSFEQDVSTINLVREWIGTEDERMQMGHRFSFVVRVWKS